MMWNILLLLLLLQIHFIVTANSIKVQLTNNELKAVGGEAKFMAENVPAFRLNVTIRGSAGGNFLPQYQPLMPSPIINCGCCICVQLVCPCNCPPECRHTTSYPPNSSQSINTTLSESSTTSPRPHLSTSTSKRSEPSTTLSPSTPYTTSSYPQQLRCCLLLNIICSICSCQKCGFPYINDGNSYLAGPPSAYHSALLYNHGQYNPFLQELLNKMQKSGLDLAKSKSMGSPENKHESNNLIMSKKFSNDQDAFLTNVRLSNKNENEQQSSPTILDAASNWNDNKPTAMKNHAKTNSTISDDENVKNIGSAASESLTLFPSTIVGLPAFIIAIFLHILM